MFTFVYMIQSYGKFTLIPEKLSNGSHIISLHMRAEYAPSNNIILLCLVTHVTTCIFPASSSGLRALYVHDPTLTFLF